MKLVGRSTGYSVLRHRRNDDILEEIKVDPVQLETGTM
jgi:hypothetical protein